ncbi:6-carboxytetrahydropterin synthase QueD [Candidatus Woesearchaeota archaeon]|nr:6-carboxytetrahydropterin synthase QueD [Candidatus Woesearchaeota archaeon]
MWEVKKRFMFSAAHHLPGYNGACANVHGHNYFVEVCVRAEELDEQGMVIDFKELGDIVKEEAISQLDHTDLNEIMEQPTAENIAKWIYDAVKPKIPGLYEIVVQETPKCSASYREG